jgi:hypothetical protein
MKRMRVSEATDLHTRNGHASAKVAQFLHIYRFLLAWRRDMLCQRLKMKRIRMTN